MQCTIYIDKSIEPSNPIMQNLQRKSCEIQYISTSTCDTKTFSLLTKLTSQKLKKSLATNSFLSSVGAGF